MIKYVKMLPTEVLKLLCLSRKYGCVHYIQQFCIGLYKNFANCQDMHSLQLLICYIRVCYIRIILYSLFLKYLLSSIVSILPILYPYLLPIFHSPNRLPLCPLKPLHSLDFCSATCCISLKLLVCGHPKNNPHEC